MAERGRPRAFDRDIALQRAMELFWERGYEGTSISDLTRAMGVNAPSLYAAFDDKEALFREAITLYRNTAGSIADRALRDEPTARSAVEAMLRGNADLYARPGRSGGCMFVLSGIGSSPKSSEVSEYLTDHRRKVVEAIEARLARGVADGDLPVGTDVSAIARFYGTVLHGISIEARDGVPWEKLNSIVDSGMLAWDALVAGSR